MNTSPSSLWRRRLLRAWILLIALTLLSIAAAATGYGLDGAATLGGITIALTAAFYKARLVLDHFLDLRRAGPNWRLTFNALLIGILGPCLLIYIVATIR